MQPGTTASGTVEVTNLHHRYGGIGSQEVLLDVSLKIPHGRLVALLGPSGCGKTTLLRSIAGLERPYMGEISIDGKRVCGPSAWVPPERRQVGMVFQDWALFPHMTVAKNVGYGLEREGRASRVEAALERVGLAGFGDRLPATLSGGQQQRVALARALAPEPKILLLDEPFSNLDSSLRATIRSEVHHLLLDVGITAIFVTHDQEEAFVLGDEVAVMNEGQIIQIASPHELYATPATRWVAEFVGEASMMRGSGNGGSVATPIGNLPLEHDHRGPLDVLIRPEQLVISGDGTAKVELIEYYGHDAMVSVRVGDESIRVRTGPDPRVSRGDHVNVAFTGTTVRAFPAES